MPTAFALVGLLASLAIGSAARATEETPAVAAGPGSPHAVRPLAVGDRAPQLTLKTIDGKSFELAPLIAKQAVVLIFYRGGW